MSRTIVLTGDRPTGKMHLGHYVGSLKNRFEMQDEFQCFFMIADYQALTTHRDRTEDLEHHVREMVLDYLAAGFDPEKKRLFFAVTGAATGRVNHDFFQFGDVAAFVAESNG